MKFALLIFTSTIFLTAFAEARQAIPAAQLQAYKTATLAAIDWNKFTCIGDSWGFHMSEVIKNANEGALSDEGEQPLIMFKQDFSGNELGGESEIVWISSTSDYKTITSVVKQTYRVLDVNKGDLRNPVIMREPVLQATRKCDKKN